MRLIDADKIDFSKVFGGHSEFAKDLIAAAQELIDIQPTAFDKEKVINELLSASICSAPDEDSFVELEEAIEIIEEGGIE